MRIVDATTKPYPTKVDASTICVEVTQESGDWPSTLASSSLTEAPCRWQGDGPRRDQEGDVIRCGGAVVRVDRVPAGPQWRPRSE